jgi:DNA helicase-2/ATP-dependent DNA helicase PcrA
VQTPAGEKKIEEILPGETVITASGYGQTGMFQVLETKQFQYAGNLVRIKTASGAELSCTPNHLLFARWGTTDNYFVYLMRSGSRYRIGVAQGSRFDGKKHDIGLRVRANQERADAMWVLKVCSTRTEALYYECLLAYQYGIPMLVFHAFANRSMQFEQKYIDAVYDQIDTPERAGRLMADLGLLAEYPHFMPDATTRGGRTKLNLNVILFGDRRTSSSSPWSASRIALNTSDPINLAAFSQLGYTVRPGRAGTFRSEMHYLDYGRIEQALQQLLGQIPSTVQVRKYAFLTEQKFNFTPAAHVFPGMALPLHRDGMIIEDRVVEVTTEAYEGPVYDLDVSKVHNYIAAGMVVHNSIYSWRGANYQNILNFEKDYPQAQVIKLEQNYRSTRNILDAAHAIITKNRTRSDKKLWTQAESGAGIGVINVYNEIQEGEWLTPSHSGAGSYGKARAVRFCRALPHQRPKPVSRRSLFARRSAVQNCGWHPLLRAQRN